MKYRKWQFKFHKINFAMRKYIEVFIEKNYEKK